MEISQDFEEFLGLLNENKVKYLVVGGYAFAVHARPRYTNDLDIWILSDPENAKQIFKAINDFTGNNLDLGPEDFLASDKIIQIGFPPLRIDILTTIDGVEFQTAWTRRIESAYGNQKMIIMGKEDLIQNKKASGRKRDLRDLEELECD